MASNTLVVRNMTKYNIGLRTQNNTDYNIRPGSFMEFEPSEIKKWRGETKLFASGELVVEEPIEELRNIGLLVPDDAPSLNEEDVKKHLNGTISTMTKWLNTIEEKWQLSAIYDIALDMDLSVKKMQVLDAKIPERALLTQVQNIKMEPGEE